MFCIITLWSGTGCLKRIAVPVTSQEITKSYGNLIYVYLEPAIYSDKDVILIKNPKLVGGELIGLSKEDSVRIPLHNVQWVDVVKIDKKKVIIGSSIFAVLVALSVLYAHGLSSLESN